MTCTISSSGTWQRAQRPNLRPLSPNEHPWLEVIRLASWDADPAPTLESVQKLRRIFGPTKQEVAR